MLGLLKCPEATVGRNFVPGDAGNPCRTNSFFWVMLGDAFAVVLRLDEFFIRPRRSCNRFFALWSWFRLDPPRLRHRQNTGTSDSCSLPCWILAQNPLLLKTGISLGLPTVAFWRVRPCAEHKQSSCFLVQALRRVVSSHSNKELCCRYPLRPCALPISVTLRPMRCSGGA